MPVAFAGTDGRARSAAQTVTSGTWKVEASTTVFVFLSPLVAPAPQYTTVTNTGTLNLVGTTYTLTSVGLLAGTVALKSCSGTWNETAHTCSGTTTTLVTNTTGTLSASASVTGANQFPPSPNGTVRLQVSLNAAAAASVTSTLSASANRSQVRSATTNNS